MPSRKISARHADASACRPAIEERTRYVMCGICGFTGASENDLPTLKAMCDVMAHRGPDGEGRYIDGGIALGHRRLSLIDIKGGGQPLVRSSGSRQAAVTSASLAADGPSSQGVSEGAARGDYAIVFNGEIYNYLDLKSELEDEGWEFHTESDTEVLLVAWIAWGEGALARLRGMFAFAIWDRTCKELFCARDFFGIKPFYYATVDGESGRQFLFASEIKSILEHPAYERRLNEDALEQYLQFQFSALRETFFKGIFKLPPGHCLRVSADGTTELRRYWRPSFSPEEAFSLEGAAQAIDVAVRESVRYHNVADVEVGAFLSSGVDSSYLAACLSEINPEVKTFTVGFSEYARERDELSWARDLAAMLGIANDGKRIGDGEYWASLPRIQWHMDEPSADPSAVALYFVDQLASSKVKAVLSGEGADELFGGYRIYQAPAASRKLSWMPRGLRRGASRILRAAGLRGASYLNRTLMTCEDWYYTNANGLAFSTGECARLLKRPLSGTRPQDLTAPSYAEVANEDEVTRMQYVDLRFWLAEDILLKTDKMSMAHSLESRVPFLDKEVFEIARALPTKLKVDDAQTKTALRTAAERIIPKRWAQKEKLGFPVPIAGWLKQERYRKLVESWLTGPEASRFFRVEELTKLLDEHCAGVKDNSRKIWIVYMFLIWYRVFFVDRAKPEIG